MDKQIIREFADEFDDYDTFNQAPVETPPAKQHLAVPLATLSAQQNEKLQVPYSMGYQHQKCDYYLTLRVKFYSEFGENIGVVGNIPELGSWKKDHQLIRLKWTEGHIWETEEPIFIQYNASRPPYFMYKYVLLNEDHKFVKYEEGMDRIADLALLGDTSHHYSRLEMQTIREEMSSKTNLQEREPSLGLGPASLLSKHVQIVDEWETFKVCFSALADTTSQYDSMRVCFSTEEQASHQIEDYANSKQSYHRNTSPVRHGSPQRSARIGNDSGFKGSPTRGSSSSKKQVAAVELGGTHSSEEMTRAISYQSWASKKYGEQIRPYECLVTLVNPHRVRINDHLKIFYHYRFQKGGKGLEFVERSPVRYLEVQDPIYYKGNLGTEGSPLQHDTSQVFMVNGLIHKCDGNFMGDFQMSQVRSQTFKQNAGHLFIGSYPSEEQDLLTLRNNKIEVLINLMTPGQMQDRQLDSNAQANSLRRFQIPTVVNVPIDDQDTEAYKHKIFEVAQRIHDFISNKNQSIFLHCQSGLSRAPTLALTYLCLFKRVKTWYDVEATAAAFKEDHPGTYANVAVVNKIIEENQEFQDKQLDAETEEQLQSKALKKHQDEQRRIEEERQLAMEMEQHRAAEKRLQQEFERQLQELQESHRIKMQTLEMRENDLKQREFHNSQLRQQNQQKELRNNEQLAREREMHMNAMAHLNQQIQSEEQLRDDYQSMIPVERKKLADAKAAHEAQMRDMESQYQADLKQFESDKIKSKKEISDLREKLDAEIDAAQQQYNLLLPRVEEIRMRRRTQSPVRSSQTSVSYAKKKTAEMQEAQRQKDRQKRLSKVEQSTQEHHFARQYSKNIYVTEQDLEDECDQLFSREAPMVFIPSNDALDERIADIIYEHHITIPIVRVRENFYLIGSQCYTCDLRTGNPMIRVGGGYQRFDEYVPRNLRFHQKKLLSYMINQNKSLEWVVQQLIDGKPLHSSINVGATSPTRESRKF